MVQGGIVMQQEAKRGGVGLARGLGIFSLAAGIITATAATAGSFLFSICPMCTGYVNETTPEPAGEQEKQPEPKGKSRDGQSQLSPVRQDVRRVA